VLRANCFVFAVDTGWDAGREGGQEEREERGVVRVEGKKSGKGRREREGVVREEGKRSGKGRRERGVVKGGGKEE